MSYTRKFKRNYDKVNEIAAEQPKSSVTLSQRIVAAVTAAGFVLNPMAVFASTISRLDGGAEVKFDNHVAQVWAGKVVGNAAVNVFSKYDVSAGDIANMYFKTSAAGVEKNNLVNFVTDRINVNGTVNAIQNSKIGGNMFFLSKDGMAVGKSGVINTGSLYVMTPTDAKFNELQKMAFQESNDANNAVTELTNNWRTIPVNPSGTITVLGKVNAVDEVQLRAARIAVGKNITDEKIGDVSADGVVKEATIKTGVADFADLVNIGSTKAGLNGDLKVTQTGSGDIVLAAYSEKAYDNSTLGSMAENAGNVVADIGKGTFTYNKIQASVENYGTIETAGEKGAVELSAEAKNAGSTEAERLAKVDAFVTVDGKVAAKGDVAIKADALNEFKADKSFFESGVQMGISSATPITGDVSYADLRTAAKVNINKGSSVDGANVDIDAVAKTTVATAASTTAYKDTGFTVGGTAGSYVPAASVVYTRGDNTAEINIDGAVNASKNLTVDADGKLKIDADNKLSISGDAGNQFVAGVMVTDGDNKAKINIGQNDNTKGITAGEDAVIKANAKTSLKSTETFTSGDNTAILTAVNVTNLDTDAAVNINSDIEAGKNLNIDAVNTITDNTVTAENKIGKGKYMSGAFQVMGQNGSISNVKGWAKEGLGSFIDSLGIKKKGGAENNSSAPSLADMLEVGVSVTVANEKNNAGVTIGKDAELKANDGKLGLNAQTIIEDTHILAGGKSNAYSTEGTDVVISGSVLVNDMENTAKVVVADRENKADKANPTLYGKTGVTANSEVKFEYNRINKMIEDVKNAADTFAKGFNKLDEAFKKDYQDTVDKINEKFNALKDVVNAISGKDETYLATDESSSDVKNFIDKSIELLGDIEAFNKTVAKDAEGGLAVAQNAKDIVSGFSDMVTGALAFADPNSYGNFAAVSAATGSSGDTGAAGGHAAPAVTGAGSVIYNEVTNNSVVNIGSKAAVVSEGTVDIDAKSYMKDVSLGGLHAGLFTTSSGTAAGIGATVNYSDLNTNTAAVIGDGAVIDAGTITIDGSNTIDHVAVAGGAGQGASDQTGSKGVVFNGMVSYINGTSKILTAVDDGAVLSAAKNNIANKAADEDKDTEKNTNGEIFINSLNDTSIVNVAASLAHGQGTAAVGAGVAVTDFDVQNIAAVADVNEQGKALFGGSDKDAENEKALNELLGTEHKASDDQGSITAYGLDVTAATKGSIESVSVAGSAANNDSSGEGGFFTDMNNAFNKVGNAVVGQGGLVDKASSSIFGNGSGNSPIDTAINAGGNTSGSSSTVANNGIGKGFMPKFSIAGAGSVSVNDLDNVTKAVIDNVNITMVDDGDVNAVAKDVAYTGSYSGSAAIQWRTSGQQGETGKSVAISGAVGVNNIANTTSALISGSTITGAGNLNATALSSGEQLALGLGVELVKADQGNKAYSVGAAGSVNLINHTVEALLEDNTVTDTDNVNVIAYASDVENTGGGNMAAGQAKGAVGATVGVAQLTNKINAGISGGSYDVNTVDVQALNALTNVTAGVSLGISVNEDATGIEGAGVYNEVNNTSKAFIGDDKDNADKFTITAKKVAVTAQDTNTGAAKEYEATLNKLAEGQKSATSAMGTVKIDGKDESYLDLDGSKYLASLNKDADDTGYDGFKDKDGKTVNLQDRGIGSNIITVAGAMAATNGKGAVGASAAITKITNDYTAEISGVTIKADDVAAKAESNSRVINVAGGVGGSNKFSGVGSVAWNDVNNTAAVNIKNAVINAGKVDGDAANKAKVISVAGQIGGSKKAAIGAALSYVNVNNSAKVNYTESKFDKKESGNGIEVTADANNDSNVYNIGASVEGAKEAAVSGTVVVT